MTHIKKCYFCGKRATSSEHVPARCLFPEEKDLGPGYRKNLITVPSCVLHNSMKSKDDEYLLFCLTMNIKSNELAKRHASTKLLRTLDRSPDRFRQFLVNARSVWVHDSETGRVFQTIGYDADTRRLDRIFRQIAAGLYMHELGKRYSNGKFDIVVNGLMATGPKAFEENERLHAFEEGLKSFFSSMPFKGENLEVFRYKTIQRPKSFVIQMDFWEVFSVIVRLRERGYVPSKKVSDAGSK